MQQVWTKQQLKVTLLKKISKQRDVDRSSQKGIQKMVLKQSACVISLYVNSYIVVMIKVLTDKSDLRVERKC